MSRQPLADLVRPKNFDEIAGQTPLCGKNGVIRRICEEGKITSMIFYGPPGVGKTTVAGIIAEQSDLHLCRLNATTASLADVKACVSQTDNVFGSGGVLLYLDEIQYFNKKQQQSLLEYLEDGRVTMIASTTENPYFYIYPAILSRCSVFAFRPVLPEEMLPTLHRALEALSAERDTPLAAEERLLLKIAGYGSGDVRRAIGILENVAMICGDSLTEEAIESIVEGDASLGVFDRSDTVHYDLLSSLQKSIRGSDPDAAVFYVAKLLAGGDLLSVCRRLQVIASEDIGLAYPSAIATVNACVEAARSLGLPEARIPLADAAILLATVPKSNSGYLALAAAEQAIESGKGQVIPPHLRAPKYEGYKYPHDYPNHYVEQRYLPEDLGNAVFYHPADNKTENAAKEYWDKIKAGGKRG